MNEKPACKPQETCDVCGLPARECYCCESCGHTCPRDLGEPYCPVCFPEPEGAMFTVAGL
ncbi:MAG: hypothetical protein HZA20_12575 [Nitrospirae bacterium]|nr:hypothetical protein [Nitrospirota bacterium]